MRLSLKASWCSVPSNVTKQNRVRDLGTTLYQKPEKEFQELDYSPQPLYSKHVGGVHTKIWVPFAILSSLWLHLPPPPLLKWGRVGFVCEQRQSPA